MLKQRVMTALVMMSVFLVTLFFASWQIFSGLAGLVFLVGAWEWSRLSGVSQPLLRLAYTAVNAALGLALLVWTQYASDLTSLKLLLYIACAWWLIAIALIKSYPGSAALLGSPGVRMLIGVLVLVPAWIAAVYLSQMTEGPLVVLLCFLTVAAVDIGAYFSGRRFGKRKLSPAVSPGKSWEGVWGGLLFSGIIGTCYVALFGDMNSVWVIAVIVPAALISIVGDLLESLIKRIRGVKDSSALLPGHGGVLDRLDGVVAAVPVFALMVLLCDWSL